MRGAAGNFVEQVQGQVDAGLPGDGRDVEHGVGGAAQGHVHRHGVDEGLQGGDVPGQDLAVHHVHDLEAGFLGQADAGGVHRRDGAVAGQGQPQGFAQAVHGVGGEHAGAGAAAGAGAFSQFLELIFADLAGLDRAHAFKDRDQVHLLALEAAGQHGAAGDQDGRDVEAQGRHEHARDDLVAVGHQDQAVHRMGRGHDFDGVGDDLPGGQGIFHALMMHGQAVADADDPELQGGAAGQAHPGLGGLGDLVQVDVAGNEFVEGIGHPDDGLVNLPVGEAHGLEERAVRVLLQTQFHQIAAHGRLLQRSVVSGQWSV